MNDLAFKKLKILFNKSLFFHKSKVLQVQVNYFMKLAISKIWIKIKSFAIFDFNKYCFEFQS